MYNEEFMKEALRLAQIAYAEGEVPVGAVVVKENQIVGRGYNRRETDKNSLAHAELLAINDACKNLGGWRLWQCDIYVTLEPCPMCAGAIINSRIQNVYYGAKDSKAGSLGSLVNLFEIPYNHRPELEGGHMEEECANILSKFFKDLRNKRSKNNKE